MTRFLCWLGFHNHARHHVTTPSYPPLKTTNKVQNGIADYLDQFTKSPYSYPVNDRESVVGASSLKGSWLSHHI